MLAQAWERLMRPSLSPFVIAVVIAGPALAQISQEWSRCLNETGTHSFDATIAACTPTSPPPTSHRRRSGSDR